MLVRSLLLATAIALPGVVGASVQAEIPVTDTDSGQYLSDAAVTADVKRALIAQRNLDALEIKVSTRKGVVQLSGFAGTSAQISQAIEVARGVRGVREVKNELRLKLADKP
ncbi:MAG TPA: BON domain-containing protein [Solimonas sp.]